jgi:hypothetical protein
MKAFVEISAFILLAIPVAILILWAAPGLGVLFAIILVAISFYVHTQRASSAGLAHHMTHGAKGH